MKRAVYQSISKYKQLLIKPNRRARTKQGSGKFPCSVQGFCCHSHENHSFCKAVSLLSPWALIALLGQAIQENTPLSAWLKEGREGIWLFKSTMCSDKKKTQPIIPREDNASKWIGTPHLRPERGFSPLASVFTRKPRIPQLQWEMQNLGISSIWHWKWFFPKQTDSVCHPQGLLTVHRDTTLCMLEFKSAVSNRLVDLENKLMVTKGEMGEACKLGGWDEHIHNVLYIKQIIKDLRYSAGNATQYSVITYMEKESEKEQVYVYVWASQLAQCVRIRLPMPETQRMKFQSLGQQDPLESEMATHSSILAWKIP